MSPTPPLVGGTLDTMPDVGLPPGHSRTFLDVPGAHPFFTEIEHLVTAGVTGGCVIDPNLFCPDDPVTRAQVAVFLERVFRGPAFVPPPANGIFIDVPVDSSFAPWIEHFFNDGMTQGCNAASTQYCPDALVSRGEIAVFLLRTLRGRGFVPPPAAGDFDDVPIDDPFAPWIEELVRLGISVGCGPATYCPAAPTPRKQLAALIYRASLIGP